MTIAVRGLFDPRLDALVTALRERFGSEVVPRGPSAGRRLAHALVRNRVDGLLIDWLTRRAAAEPQGPVSFRELSVYRLGRSFGFAEGHARKVAALALELFDSAREAGLHEHGEGERELLEYAALLHDIGVALSFNNHHAHSAYFIRNADLLGFDETEIALIAAVARFHRRQYPRKSHPEVAELPRRLRRVVRDLAMFLTLAEKLDRGHLGAVTSARLRAGARKQCVLELRAARDCQLEVWGVQDHVDAFRRTFGRQLAVEVTTAAAPAPTAGGPAPA